MQAGIPDLSDSRCGQAAVVQFLGSHLFDVVAVRGMLPPACVGSTRRRPPRATRTRLPRAVAASASFTLNV